MRNVVTDEKPKYLRPHSYSFFKRFARNLIIGMSITFIFLIIGMIGFHYYERADWIEAYANAAMIMSGVGPIANPITNEGKIFAGTYSLLSGMGYLIVIGIVFAPVFHWIFRQIHIEQDHLS